MPGLDPITPPRGPAFQADMRRAWEILGRLNALAPGDFDAMRALLAELTGQELDPSVRVLPPFYTDTGRNLRFGATCSSTTAAPRWTSEASRSATT